MAPNAEGYPYTVFHLNYTHFQPHPWVYVRVHVQVESTDWIMHPVKRKEAKVRFNCSLLIDMAAL